MPKKRKTPATDPDQKTRRLATQAATTLIEKSLTYLEVIEQTDWNKLSKHLQATEFADVNDRESARQEADMQAVFEIGKAIGLRLAGGAR